MNTEELEFVKDYTEFANNIDKAIEEQISNGYIKQETHNEVGDVFASLCDKLDNMPLNFITGLLVGDIIRKLDNYTYMTGHTFNASELILKYLAEKIKE